MREEKKEIKQLLNEVISHENFISEPSIKSWAIFTITCFLAIDPFMTHPRLGQSKLADPMTSSVFAAVVVEYNGDNLA